MNHIRDRYEPKIEPGYHCTGLALTMISTMSFYHVRDVRTVYHPTVRSPSFPNQNHHGPFKRSLWTFVATVDSSFLSQSTASLTGQK